MISLQQFINTNNGKGLDVDGYPPEQPYQCTDLVEVWADQNGWPRLGGNAIDFFGQHPDFFDWTLNTPSGVPSAGDILVWYANSPAAGTGPAGHTGIFVSGDTNTFTAFNQNFNDHPYCELTKYNYGGLKGWGHAKNQPQTNQGDTPMPADFWETPLSPADAKAWYEGYLGREPEPNEDLTNVKPGPFLQAATQELLKRAAGESANGTQVAAKLQAQIDDLTKQLTACQKQTNDPNALTITKDDLWSRIVNFFKPKG